MFCGGIRTQTCSLLDSPQFGKMSIAETPRCRPGTLGGELSSKGGAKAPPSIEA